MGLDMYVYKSLKDDIEIDENNLIINDNLNRSQDEFAYWRKHPALHSWMENLYYDRGGMGTFNGIPLLLNELDLKKLKKDLVKRKLNHSASGFFFGQSADPKSQDYIHQLKKDLKFIFSALKEIKKNEDTIFIYDSSW